MNHFMNQFPGIEPAGPTDFESITGQLAGLGESAFTITNAGMLVAPTVGFLFDLAYLVAVEAAANDTAILYMERGSVGTQLDAREVVEAIAEWHQRHAVFMGEDDDD